MAVAVAALLGACTTGEKAPPGSRFVVNVPRAQFYKYGPAQSFGADFVLPKGQRVIMLARQFGFSRVMTEDGISGWIASEEISPAPPETRRLAASASANRRRGDDSGRMYSGPRKTSNLKPVPGDPFLDMSDLPPPPLPEEPDKPKPKFRAAPPRSE